MRKMTFEEITSQRISPENIDKFKRFPIYALLNDVRSLYNVGSIFRTSDAVRLSRLFLTGITGCPPRKEIDKTALGAVDSVPWSYEKDPLKVVDSLKSSGSKIYVLEHTSRSLPYQQIKFGFPACLVVGNEVFGIANSLIDAADEAVEIPMYGTKQSLNVTIAYGIVIYEMLQQYLMQT